MKKFHAFLSTLVAILLLLTPVDGRSQCLTAVHSQHPAGNQNVGTCDGSFTTFATDCWNSQYTSVNVELGHTYTFKSSVATDFVTISDAAGALAYTSGIGSVIWTATLTTTVRFYTHSNAACGADQINKSRSASCTLFNPVPAFSHIVVVIGENTASGSIFGNANAPYINALAADGAYFTHSYALFHPSQPNYLGLFSGSKQGITNDAYISTPFTTNNLGAELINALKTYATYSEGLPSVGYNGNTSGKYARKHNPAANWVGTGTNQIPTTTNQPFTSFPTDFNQLPSVAFVVPDLCNDGHDLCPPLNNKVKQYDTWVQTNLDAYKQWCTDHNSLLIVTYDEDDGNAQNQIATVFYGAQVVQGTYNQNITHYNVLRTLEEANRLTTHTGAAATAAPIDFCWTSSVVTATSDPETAGAVHLLAYPNPFSSELNISCTLEKDGLVQMEMYDLLGRPVYSSQNKMEPGTHIFQINSSELPVLKGILLLKVSANGAAWQTKVVKMD